MKSLSNTPTSQSVLIEDGAVSGFDDLLGSMQATRLFFVIDKLAYEHSGAAEALAGCVRHRTTTWFSGFEPNPKLEDVERGIALFRDSAADVVVALGGGSAMDMAKLIAGCGAQVGRPIEYVTGYRDLREDPPPMIAIPTTSGTGSEATHFAVVYVDGQKFSLAHQSLLPVHVLIDPQLTYSLPPSETASCGLDALSQAMESIWSVCATEESIAYASESLGLALENLEAAVWKPTPAARMTMARAAHLSGKAINISKTTAPHALSYAITTRYGVPHGAAVALTLGAFLEFNYNVDEGDCIDPRGVAAVRARIETVLEVMGTTSWDEAQRLLHSIISGIGCPVRLREVGIRRNDFDSLVDEVNVERMANNPRRIDAQTMKQMLERLM